MPVLHYFIQEILFPQLKDQAIDKIKSAWKQYTQKDWEELYLDAFEQALKGMRPQLEKYSDTLVDLPREDLRAILHRDILIRFDERPLTGLTGQDLANRISEMLSDRETLILGGHTLSKADYASLVYNLVRSAQSIFRQSILKDEVAFKLALLSQTEYNTSQFNQALAFLQEHYRLLVSIEQQVASLAQLIEGMRGAVTDYSGPVREFIQHYIGTPTEPQPFGGRQDELETLGCWLEDPSQPPYASIIAPAGRGKSALLAHWVTRLAVVKDNPWHVVYFPISARYGTNREEVVFAGLVTRLSPLFGELKAKPQSAAEWRAIWVDNLQNLPKGKRVLVVFDGLDEATGWEVGANIFPGFPPENLKVLVAARQKSNDDGYHDWHRRLGWNRPDRARPVDLPFLTYPGFLDVLVKMGNPLNRLPERDGVPERLYELSEGDPLLIGLYIESLLEHRAEIPRLTVANLESLEPGIESFMKNWMEDQENIWKANPLKEKPVRALLYLCALAHGPLTPDDLYALGPDRFEEGLDIESAAKSVDRFLVQAGKLPGKLPGYTYSHPLLADYFRNQLVEGNRKRWQQRFVDYGKQVFDSLNSGALQPARASTYIVQYYSTHLSDANASPENFYILMSQAWLRAWETLFGTPDGFLTDVDRAWQAANQQGREALGKQILAALCHSSVISQSSGIRSDLFENLLKYGVFSPPQAEYYAHQQVDLENKIHLFTILLNYVQEPKRTELLEEALGAAQQIQNEESRQEILSSLAPHLPERLLEEALAAAQKIEDEWVRARALIALAPHLPEQRRVNVLEEALAAAQKIEDEGMRARVLADLAPHLPEQRRVNVLEEALAAAQKIEAEWVRARVLTALAPHLPERLLEEALAAAQKIENGWVRAGVLAALAPHLPEQHRVNVLEEALAAAQKIQDEGMRANVLTALAPQLPERLLEEALAAAQKIEVGWGRARVLTALAPHLPERLLEEALAAAQKIEVGWGRASVLTALAPQLPEQRRVNVLEEALAAAQKIEDEEYRARALIALAPHLPERLLEEALAAAQKIEAEEISSKGSHSSCTPLAGAAQSKCVGGGVSRRSEDPG